MTAPGEPNQRRERLRGGAAITVAVGVMNVAFYAFAIVAAHNIGPDSFGALTALLNVGLVASVLALALQATAARRIAREPHDAGLVEDVILQVGRRAAFLLGTLFLVLSPVVNHALQLHSITTAVMLAVAVVPLTMVGGQAGVLQGERRWLPLSLLYLAAGVPRLILGLLFVSVHPDESAAFLAVTISAFAPVLVGSWALRRRPRAQRGRGDHTARALWWETIYNSQALLAFLALSSLDIVIARNTLRPQEAGLYAAGLILVKAVKLLPQFVVVLAFPSMGTDEAPRAALVTSLLVVAFTGLAITLGVRLLPHLAQVFVGGDKYADVSDRLWVFALLGTVISLVQLLVYSVLARPARTSVVLLWSGLVAMVIWGSGSSSVTDLIHRVLLVDVVLLVALLVVSLRQMGRTSTTSLIVSTA